MPHRWLPLQHEDGAELRFGADFRKNPSVKCIAGDGEVSQMLRRNRAHAWATLSKKIGLLLPSQNNDLIVSQSHRRFTRCGGLHMFTFSRKPQTTAKLVTSPPNDQIKASPDAGGLVRLFNGNPNHRKAGDHTASQSIQRTRVRVVSSQAREDFHTFSIFGSARH